MSKYIRADLPVAAMLLAATASRPAGAHGFGQRYDLPVPLWLWITGAAAAVILSFVIVGFFVRRKPRVPGESRVNLLRWRLGRLLAGRSLRLAAQAVAVGLLLLVVTAGLFGDQNPTRNLAPVWVWVIWWVGIAYVSALAGNLWAAINPWAAIFGWAEALVRRAGGDGLALGLPYPRWLGMWPAIALFATFAWIELVYSGRAVPAQLALLITAYSLITWTGMTLFGHGMWLRHADPFAATFGLFARFSPTEIRVTDPAACRRCEAGCLPDRDGCFHCAECFDRADASARQWNLRPYGAGLQRSDDVTLSMAAFVLLLLSTVAFDGFTATPAWARLESSLYAALTPLGGARLTAIGTFGFLAFSAFFGAVYGLFSYWIARAGGGDLSAGTVARLFVLSLVPIAIAYHLAHYLTYLLIQGQLVIRLASDPYGFGWNLLGTARYLPDIGIVGARFAWYASVIAIVLGHIIAVYVAHAIALARYPDRSAAIRSQVPMLILMVGYTMAGLWMVAQPIVESAPRG
jgi:hypothetical protein